MRATFAGSMAFLLGLAAANADTHASVSGWESLSFGMSPQETQTAMPSVGWKPSPSWAQGTENSNLDSVSPVHAWNHSFRVRLEFVSDKLYEINLETTRDDPVAVDSLAACTNDFEAVLLLLEKQYGPFVPIYQSVLPTNKPDSPMYVPMTLVVKSVAGSSSKYDFKTVRETTQVTDYTNEAKTSFGPPGIIVSMDISTDKASFCSLEIQFNQVDLSGT